MFILLPLKLKYSLLFRKRDAISLERGELSISTISKGTCFMSNFMPKPKTNIMVMGKINTVSRDRGSLINSLSSLVNIVYVFFIISFKF